MATATKVGRLRIAVLSDSPQSQQDVSSELQRADFAELVLTAPSNVLENEETLTSLKAAQPELILVEIADEAPDHAYKAIEQLQPVDLALGISQCLGLSGISQFWGLPKGMGAIFAVLYLSPNPLSLDELVAQTGLTKGSISTSVRSLSRMGLVRPISHLGDRKDYYEAETDFYRSMRTILKSRQNSEFDRAVASVRQTLQKLEALGSELDPERAFLIERVRALKDFYEALDSLFNAVARLDSLGQGTIQTVLKFFR